MSVRHEAPSREVQCGIPDALNKLWLQAKVQTMVTYDDFLTMKESVVIDICKRDQIITQTQFKILDKRLGERNTAAHPNSAKVGQLQAEAFIEDLVDNVVLALPI
jgi:hypothetical protein